MNIKEIDNKIEEHERNINHIHREIEELKIMRASSETTRKLAEVIHDEFCTLNHTDGCDWGYGSWESPRHAQNKWLKKAEDIIEKKEIDSRTLIRLFEDYNSIKKLI